MKKYNYEDNAPKEINTTDQAVYSAKIMLDNACDDILSKIPKGELKGILKIFELNQDKQISRKCKKYLETYIENDYSIESLFTDQVALLCVTIVTIRYNYLVKNMQQDINLALLKPKTEVVQ